MLFNKFKNINRKYLLGPLLTLFIFISLLFCIISSVNSVSRENQDVFAYTVKVRDTVEALDKVFERAELNVNVMSDSIANSYNVSKQKDKAYNLRFIEDTNGLVKSVLSNSPNVDGSWFQLNADLPFSTYAYNWYEFKENQFIDVKDQFQGASSTDRRINPDDDPYYFNAIFSQKTVWSDIYKDADTQDSMMTVSSPIYKDDTLIGVVGIDISTDSLQEILKNMQLVLGDSELYLLDKNSKVILSQLPFNSKSPKDDYPFIKLFRGNEEGPIEYSDSLTKKTAIMLPLSNDYKIFIAMDNKTLFDGTNQLIYIIWGLFCLLVLVTGLVLAAQFKFMEMSESSKSIGVKPESEKPE